MDNETNVKKNPSTILIAEDEEMNFMFFEELLSTFNFNILHARDGLEAVNICKSNSNIDLVLMDIKMPVKNGYEATTEIKKDYPELPVVAQTAYALPDDVEKAMEAGCDDFISKPINKEVLIRILRKFLSFS